MFIEDLGMFFSMNPISAIILGDFSDLEEDSTNTVASQNLEYLSFKCLHFSPRHLTTPMAVHQTMAPGTILCLKSSYIRNHHLLVSLLSNCPPSTTSALRLCHDN